MEIKIFMTARNLVEGKGWPEWIDKEKCLVGGVEKGRKFDKATAMTLTGFALFKTWWPEIYKNLGLNNNLVKAYDQTEKEYIKLCS